MRLKLIFKFALPWIVMGLAAGLHSPAVLANSPLLQNLATGAFETIDDHRRDGQWLIVMIWA